MTEGKFAPTHALIDHTLALKPIRSFKDLLVGTECKSELFLGLV